jgi:beta-glucosidase
MTQAEAISWLNDGVPAIPRLGLPAYSWESEALHGVSWNGVATVFPGKTPEFYTALVYSVNKRFSDELRRRTLTQEAGNARADYPKPSRAYHRWVPRSDRALLRFPKPSSQTVPR